MAASVAPRLPLAGLRVLDMSRVLAGPWCSQMLGDAGADVVKLEPVDGDVTRAWGPPFVSGAGPDGAARRQSAYIISCNRNKRSLALNIAAPAGLAAARKLAERADIFIENDRVGSLAARGLGYEALRRANPRLVYASISGWGQVGPRAREPAYDLGVVAASGLMSVTGPEGGEPAKPGVALTDIAAGLYLHGAILTALLARASSGVGARVETSLLAAGVANLANVASSALHGGAPRARGSAHESIVPYQAFSGSDGEPFIVAATSDAQWAALLARVGGAEAAALAADARLADNAGRVLHRGAVVAGLQRAFSARPRAHWVALLADAVTAAPVNSVPEALRDAQVRARALVREVPHAALGASVRLLAHPVGFEGGGIAQPGGEAAGSTRPPPLLGEHTREGLAEAGLSAAEVDAMLAAGVAMAL
jgi:crotonobetainyl-CoA:carnitine CoA-transferase CaiB-like acyl-CoA transferase